MKLVMEILIIIHIALMVAGLICGNMLVVVFNGFFAIIDGMSISRRVE